MGRIPTVFLTASLLIAASNSFHLGFRAFPTARKCFSLQSDADQINSNNDVLKSVEVTTEPALVLETTESAQPAEVAILSNPLVIEGSDSHTPPEGTDSNILEDIMAEEKLSEEVPVPTVSSEVIADSQQQVAPVVIKDLKLASLGPAYPDDTSYMMCSGCKAG